MTSEQDTAANLLAAAARINASRPALKDRLGRALSHGDLDARTSALAAGLLRVGLMKGDRVAALLADRLEYVEVYLAAAKAGLVVVPVNARLTEYEADQILEDSQPRALLWSSDLDNTVAGLTTIDADTHRIALGPTELYCDIDYESLMTGPAATTADLLAQAALGPADPFILGYTSGTTGRPKGAVLTQGSVAKIMWMNAFSFRLYPRCTIALTGSMSFVSTVPAHVLCALGLGGTVVLMGRWAPEDLLEVIERERAAFTYVPSPLIPEVTEALAANPRRWSSLTSLLHSASKADPGKLADLVDVVGGRLVEGLGMTENSGGLVTATVPTDYLDARRGDRIFDSVGRPALGAEVSIVDEGEIPLSHDGTTVGELCFRAPAIMAGYHNLPEASARALRDGWYHTGDLGMLDEQGYVYVVERRTDLIVSGGMNVYPSEVEQCIAEFPGVAEVAVVGASHPRWRQTVVAVVVPVPGTRVSETAVVEHCVGRIASYKKPTSVIFADALPRTAGLKVARAVLRERVEAQLAAT